MLLEDALYSHFLRICPVNSDFISMKFTTFYFFCLAVYTVLAASLISLSLSARSGCDKGMFKNVTSPSMVEPLVASTSVSIAGKMIFVSSLLSSSAFCVLLLLGSKRVDLLLRLMVYPFDCSPG